MCHWLSSYISWWFFKGKVGSYIYPTPIVPSRIHTYIHTYMYVYIFLKFTTCLFLGVWERLEINRRQLGWSHFWTNPWPSGGLKSFTVTFSYLTDFTQMMTELPVLKSHHHHFAAKEQSRRLVLFLPYASPRNLTFGFTVRNTVYVLSFFKTELLLWTQNVILSSFQIPESTREETTLA